MIYDEDNWKVTERFLLKYMELAESVYRDSHLPDRYHAEPSEHMRNIITIARMIADMDRG